VLDHALHFVGMAGTHRENVAAWLARDLRTGHRTEQRRAVLLHQREQFTGHVGVGIAE